jgi:hypothetical protein
MYSSSLPYSVYATDTTKNSSGGGTGNEDLDQTLQLGNNAGLTSINMNNQDIVNVTAINTKNVITDLVQVGTAPVKIKLDGTFGDINPCNDITDEVDGLADDITSFGTLTYNLLSPAIPPFQPSSFALSGYYPTPTSFTVGVDYNMAALSSTTVFQEYPPLPNPQGAVSVLNGWFRNGLAGWYKISWKINPAIPVIVPEHFVTFTVKLKIYSNTGATPPPLITYDFPYKANPNENILNFNGSKIIYLPVNISCELGFIGTTTNNVDYIIIEELQFSGKLISKGIP